MASGWTFGLGESNQISTILLIMNAVLCVDYCRSWRDESGKLRDNFSLRHPSLVVPVSTLLSNES